VAKKYKIAKAGVDVTIDIAPKQEGYPVPSIIVQDLIDDYYLKLTAIPFKDVSTFDFWVIDGVRYQDSSNPDLYIRTTGVHKVVAYFKYNSTQKHQVTFEADTLLYGYKAYYEAFDKNHKVTIHTIEIDKNTTLELPHGTALELQDTIDVDSSYKPIAYNYLLNGKLFNNEILIFRVLNNSKISTFPKINLHIERCDLIQDAAFSDSYDGERGHYRFLVDKNIKTTVFVNGMSFTSIVTKVFQNIASLDMYIKDIIKLAQSSPNFKNDDIIYVKVIFNDVSNEPTYKVNLETLPKGISSSLNIKTDIHKNLLSIAISSFTVKHNTKVYAEVELLPKRGYKVKSWSNNTSTSNHAEYLIDKDMTIAVELEKKV